MEEIHEELKEETFGWSARTTVEKVTNLLSLFYHPLVKL